MDVSLLLIFSILAVSNRLSLQTWDEKETQFCYQIDVGGRAYIPRGGRDACMTLRLPTDLNVRVGIHGAPDTHCLGVSWRSKVIRPRRACHMDGQGRPPQQSINQEYPSSMHFVCRKETYLGFLSCSEIGRNEDIIEDIPDDTPYHMISHTSSDTDDL